MPPTIECQARWELRLQVSRLTGAYGGHGFDERAVRIELQDVALRGSKAFVDDIEFAVLPPSEAGGIIEPAAVGRSDKHAGARSCGRGGSNLEHLVHRRIADIKGNRIAGRAKSKRGWLRKPRG